MMNPLYNHRPYYYYYYGYRPYVYGGDSSNYYYCYDFPHPLWRPSLKQESESAVKIQRAFREFLWRRNVKKSMRKIAELNREIDEVANRYLKEGEGEGLDLLKRDAYERFKVSEIVLGLIIKLDSVEVVDDSVRVCRKSVVNKAVLLQEKIDSLEKMEVSEATAEAEEEWLIVDDESSGNKQRRLMEMVADLGRKNAQQARIISSLSERVKQLEIVTRRLTGALRD